MTLCARLSLASLLLLCVSTLIHGQALPDQKKRQSPKVGGAAKTEESDARAGAEQRRAIAVSLLLSLANDARNFRDQTLRARTQARIAEALWEVDADQGRALFRKAWEAAEVADKEGQERQQEEIRAQRAKTGGSVTASPPNLRGEVLRLAARRDRALGEEFLGKLKEQKEQEVTDASRNRRSNPFGADEGTRLRLSLARQLLDNGDVELATQFADPALVSVSTSALNFLSFLREKNPAAADQRYAIMLGIAEGNLQTDANTASLLSSYLFTPHLFVVFEGGGASTSQMGPPSGPVEVAPELRAAFFRAATQILLRPVAASGEDKSTLGADDKYLVIKRLMPLFEQYAPQQTTAAVRAQLEALAALVRDDVRQRDDEWVRKGIGPDKDTAGEEQSLLDRIERAKTSAERDELYVQLAFFTAGKEDMRARDFADKIEDSELRHNVRAYIDGALVLQAIDKKNADRALELARTGELTRIQKVWALTQAAKLLAKSEPEKTLNLLEEATSEARRFEGSDPDRPRALLAVANALFTIDRARGWDAVLEAMKGANAAEGFTGEDGRIQIRMVAKSRSSIRTSSAQDFDLAGIFGLLARDNYERAVELARGFQGEGPRATAVIAIARSVLTEKQNKGGN